MKKSLREKISNIINAQKNADKIESYKNQIESLKYIIEEKEEKNKELKVKTITLNEIIEKYMTTTTETRIKKNGRKSL